MKNKRLSQLLPGERATVSAIFTEGGMRRRFLDIGLIPETSVECVGRSPLGDPAAYLIRGKTVAIRDADASGVELKTKE